MVSYSLDPEKLNVESFTTAPTDEQSLAIIGGGNSWPAVCTCIGICPATGDIYCSGGCPPKLGVVEGAIAEPVKAVE